MTNFATTLPPPKSDLAQQLTKDPHIFDFLGLGNEFAEPACSARSTSAIPAVRTIGRPNEPEISTRYCAEIRLQTAVPSTRARAAPRPGHATTGGTSRLDGRGRPGRGHLVHAVPARSRRAA